MSWNLHGSARPDVRRVTDAILACEPDVVCLQEVRRHQARAIAAALGWPTAAWVWKHNPWIVLPRRTEGLAILARTRPHHHRHRRVSSLRPWWDYRRRVAQRATVGEITVVNVHLATRDAEQRLAQLAKLVKFAPSDALIVGDLNEDAQGASIRALAAIGWVRCSDPTSPLDHILTPTTRAGTPVVPADRPWLVLSDHEPVLADVR